MSRPKLTYFDMAASRGEEVRLALRIAGIDFEDDRVDRAGFQALKPGTPFGSLPVFEFEGRGVFAQSNAILRLIGRMHGLYPDDPFDAARHDMVMEAVEDLRQRISATTRTEDPAQRRAARERLAAEYIPHWARGVEAAIGAGPFVGGAKPGVADIKIYMVSRWIGGGGVDDVPPEVLDGFPRLKAVTEAMRALHTGAG